jgi:hypothetical protein
MSKKKPETSRPSDALITQGLVRLTAARHEGESMGSAREWVLFRELRSGAVRGQSERSVDLFAMNMWPSKKHWRVAYELKASRADFLRELAKPEKRAWGMEVSNEFWYVCYSGIAKPEEIPEGCGLLVADEGLEKLRKAVQAPQRESRALTMTEVSSMVRRESETFGPLFGYAGRELSESDLHALLESRMDGHQRELVRQGVTAGVADALTRAREVLSRYAKDLRAANVEPPAWMEAIDFENHLGWPARSWVEDAFSKKLGRSALMAHRRTLEQSLAQARRVQESLEAAIAGTDELLFPLPEPGGPVRAPGTAEQST